MSKEYRAILSDHAEGEPGGGGIESTFDYDEFPKTNWTVDIDLAKHQGECLRKKFAGTDYADFYVRIETREVKNKYEKEKTNETTSLSVEKCCQKYAVPGQPGWFTEQVCPECNEQLDGFMNC